MFIRIILNKMFAITSLVIVVFLTVTSVQAATNANSFVSKSRNVAAFGQNGLGFGYYNAPVVYSYEDGSKDNYLSSYNGWFIKYIRYFDASSALQIHYLQAHGEEDIRELSGSALYGLNIGGPGIGAYFGISYSLKQRAQFAGEARLSNEKEYGWDYPVGVKMKSGTLTFNVETRYKYFLLEGKNINADSVRYPLFFSILMDF